MRSSGSRPTRTTTQATSAEHEQHDGDHERLDDQQPVEVRVELGQRHGDDRDPAPEAVGERDTR